MTKSVARYKDLLRPPSRACFHYSTTHLHRLTTTYDDRSFSFFVYFLFTRSLHCVLALTVFVFFPSESFTRIIFSFFVISSTPVPHLQTQKKPSIYTNRHQKLQCISSHHPPLPPRHALANHTHLPPPPPSSPRQHSRSPPPPRPCAPASTHSSTTPISTSSPRRPKNHRCLHRCLHHKPKPPHTTTTTIRHKTRMRSCRPRRAARAPTSPGSRSRGLVKGLMGFGSRRRRCWGWWRCS